MNHKLICRVIGVILSIEGLCMLAPALVSALYRENEMALSFFISAVVCGALGLLLLAVRTDRKDRLQARDGLLAVSFSWIVLSVFGAIPYWMSG